MYKLLIVDDEPLQVSLMADIVKQLKPEYEIYTAQNGQAAYDIILKTGMDILMTDIRMPIMDGLQLIGELKDHNIKLKIIILSGYREFDYVQKALRGGVLDYLLKPVKKVELVEMLGKMENLLKKEREVDVEKESLKKKLDETLPIYLDRQLNKWLAGDLIDRDLEEIESIFPSAGYGCVLITKIGKYHKLVENYSNSEIGEFIQELKYIIREELSPFGHVLSFILEKDKSMIITVINSELDFNLQASENSKKLCELMNRIKEEIGFDITIAVGEKYADIVNKVIDSYSEASFQLGFKFFQGTGKVLHHEGLKKNIEYKPIDMNEVEIELIDAIHHSNKGKLMKINADLFDTLVLQANADPKALTTDLMLITLNICRKVCTLMSEEQYNSFLSDIKDKLTYCEDYKELRFEFNRIMCAVSDIFNSKETDSNYLIVEKCKKYINENYMNDLSLGEISQKFHFSPNYFSNIFKTYAGTGFADYVNKVRIHKAKDLLKYSNDKMPVIAQKVGFNDDSYFNRIFKKELGISPYKFKQLTEKEENAGATGIIVF
jgi:two-component system, response regulator YesN